MAPRHYPLVPPVQRPPNLGDLTDEELGQLRAELEYLEKLAFLPRSRSEVGRIGRDEFPVPSGPRPLDRFEQAEREGRIPTEPIRGPEPTRKPKPTRKPEPQREEPIFTRIVERVGETPIPSPIPTERFPGRTGPITFGEAGQGVGEFLDFIQRDVEEPMAGIAASLGATAFIDPEIAEAFLFASPERKEELLQVQGILQEHAAQARQEVERKVREKNPETLIEYVRAIWTSGGEYERERPEAFVGEKGIVQILFSPLNLIGIGLEPKVARLVALLFRKLRAKATRTGRGFQEVMEDVPADDISKAPLEDVSKAPLEEVLEEVLEEAAEVPTPRLRPAPAEEVEQVGFGQAGMGFGERPPQAGMGFGRRPPPDWVRQTEEARRLRALGREGLPLEEAAEAPTRVGAQTPEGNVVGASPLVEELPHREYWARPLSNQKMISGAFRDNFWRSLAQRTQGLKQFTALIDPAALVRGDSIEPVEIVKRGLLLRNRVLDVGNSATEIGMAWLREKQLPFEIGTDMRAAGVPNSPVWYDIFDNPSRFILTPKQKEYISLYQDLVDDALRLAKDNGIEVTEIQFAGGRHYIPRLVEAIRGLENTKAKGSKAWASAKGIGAKQSFQKTRFYEWAEDGVEKGVVYSADPISVMQHHIHSVYRAIADKRLADEVRPLGETVVEGVERKSPGLLAALEIAKKDFAKARQLLSAVNRAYRGERLPPSLVNSIRRSFPAEAAMLKAAGPNSPDLYQIETRARKLMAESRITWNNISGRVGRLKEAVRSPLDKGWVSQPFAGGRMFPKEVSEVLNKATGDQGQQWLKKYEDLNALSRTIGTTIDFGAPFIQGLAVLGENPRAWARATLMHYQAFLFPQVKQRYLVQNAEAIKEMAQYGITLGHTEFLAGNLPATGLMKLLPQETQTVLTWMGRKNPFHFQEAFGTFLDAAAIESWKALRSTAGREGNDSLFALADYVNHVRGTMSQRAIGIGATQQQIESSFMAFAIRYTKAGFALLTDMVKGNLKGNAVRANLTSTIGAATLFFLAGATAMSALGLISKEEIIRRMQPILNGRYNSRFFTLPFGTDDVGLGGFGYSLLRLLAGTTDKAINEPEDLLKLDAKDNPLVSFIQSRLFGAAPMASLATELTTGTNWWGEKLTTIPDYSSAVARRFLPFWAESYLLQDPKADVKSFIPAVHGTRVFPQSYRARANKLEESLAAIKRKQETRSGTFGVVVAEESKRWDLPLNREERRILEAESPELAELKQKANEQSAGYRKNLVQEETESFYSGIELGKLRRERELEQAYLSFAQAKIGGKAFRETRATQNTKFAGAIESLKEQYPLALTDRAARERYYQEHRIAIKEAAVEDIVAEGYYSIEPRRDANGLEDMSQFFRDRKEYLERFDTETQDYVLHTYPNKRFTKEWMNKIEAIYQKDIETLRPYWEIRDQVEAEKPNASENLKNSTISARRVRMRRRDNLVQQAGKRWEYFGDVPRRDTRTRGEGLYPVTGVQGVTVINR